MSSCSHSCPALSLQEDKVHKWERSDSNWSLQCLSPSCVPGPPRSKEKRGETIKA